MESNINLKDGYIMAKCCNPDKTDEISGYFSHDKFLKVHRRDCQSLAKVEPERLVQLNWNDILNNDEYAPDDDYSDLDEIDFRILRHHLDLGIDYSLMIAKVLSIEKKTAFDKHAKLKKFRLLKRVESLMVQYRKGVIDNKWIKHRNHTYYQLTDKGKKYIEYYLTM